MESWQFQKLFPSQLQNRNKWNKEKTQKTAPGIIVQTNFGEKAMLQFSKGSVKRNWNASLLEKQLSFGVQPSK